IGISISANKVKGIRCALAHDVFSAKATREHNNANILAMGERVIGPGLAREIVTTWLDTPFEGGRHETRINKMSAYEQDHASGVTVYDNYSQTSRAGHRSPSREM